MQNQKLETKIMELLFLLGFKKSKGTDYLKETLIL